MEDQEQAGRANLDFENDVQEQAGRANRDAENDVVDQEQAGRANGDFENDVQEQAGRANRDAENDVELFLYLCIVMLHSEDGKSNFFWNENHPYPSSKSDKGNYNKDDVRAAVYSGPVDKKEPPFSFGVKVLVGAAVVFLSTTNITTFNENADSVFIPHIMKTWMPLNELMWYGTPISPAESKKRNKVKTHEEKVASQNRSEQLT